ncbi:MAG: hypothetical protein OEZ14_07945 [Acidimicrobiia bacterium]|nr:hypothetical protein [Acidimicrobiia bacterium]
MQDAPLTARNIGSHPDIIPGGFGNWGGNATSAGKGGFFRGTLGFDEAALDPAIRQQLFDEFASTPVSPARQAHQVGRIVVNSPITGPSGVTAKVTSA